MRNELEAKFEEEQMNLVQKQLELQKKERKQIETKPMAGQTTLATVRRRTPNLLVKRPAPSVSVEDPGTEKHCKR